MDLGSLQVYKLEFFVEVVTDVEIVKRLFLIPEGAIDRSRRYA